MNTAQNLTLIFLCSLTGLANAQVNQPFRPAERWARTPANGQTWVPRDVHFCAETNLVWAGVEGLNPQWQVLDVPTDQVAGPRFQDSIATANALQSRSVAPAKGSGVFGLVQEPSPDVYQQAVTVSRFSPLDAARTGNFTSDWSRTLAPKINSAAEIATDETGSIVVVAAFVSQSSYVRLEVLDGTNGALLRGLDLPGLALSGLDVSSDGSLIAVAAGLDFYLLDGSGQILHSQALNAASSALAVSGNGSRVAVGSVGQLVVLESSSAGWGVVVTLTRPLSDVVTAVDLSRDGAVMAAAWWRHTTGTWARMEMRSGAILVAQYEQLGSATSLQNLPRVVRITPDGTRAAFGTWGDGASPELVLLEAGLAPPVWEIDLPGSVTSLDLDETGTQIVVAHKDGHANTFGTSGAIRLFDTGETALRQNNPMVTGSTVSFSTHLDGGLISLLLVGQRTNAVALPGVSGLLYLDRTSLAVLPVAMDANGVGTHQFAIPMDPVLIGTSLAVQPAFRSVGATELGGRVLDPLIF